MINNSNYGAVIFQDGKIFYGRSSGKIGTSVSELCFTTASTGYQETITDPSYYGQSVIFTSVHIGNTGINSIDYESSKPQVNAIITRNEILDYSHHQADLSLCSWLEKHSVLLLHDFDTRRLVEKITSGGSQNAMLISSAEKITVSEENLESFLSQIKEYKIEFSDAVKNIISDEERKEKIEEIVNNSKEHKKKLAVIDFGIKLNILRLLDKYNFNLTVFPCDIQADSVDLNDFDGIVLSNGPADPKDAIVLSEDLINKIVHSSKPIFGICLGHQILAVKHPRLQIRVSKMHQGHRGINHPIINLSNKKIAITSQNHGFNVYLDDNDFKVRKFVSHKSLFDNSIAGFYLKDEKVLSVQYHPESSPGTHDSEHLFETFYNLIQVGKKTANDNHQEKRDLILLEKKLNYSFKSKELLLRSLRHSSIQVKHSYEKFEFIGDKVLNLALAEKLLDEFPQDAEGQLSLKLNKLVSGEIIVQVALKIELGRFIEMSDAEKQSNGRANKGNLEDCLEGIIGGIFLDSDFKTTKNVIFSLWDEYIKTAGTIEKDPKSQLQEWLQKQQKPLPEYNVIKKDGPGHNPVFTVRLSANGIPEFESEATSLKEAQVKIARMALDYISDMKG